MVDPEVVVKCFPWPMLRFHKEGLENNSCANILVPI